MLTPIPALRPDVRLVHQVEGDRRTIARYRAAVKDILTNGACPNGGSHAWIPVQGGGGRVCAKCGQTG